MKRKWLFTLPKAILLYCCGIILGAEIILLVTHNIRPLAGILEIVAVALITGTLVVSSRQSKKESQT